MSRPWHRLALLEAKALVLGLGPVPWLATSALVGAAFVQEPSIFRQQDLALAWPFTLTAADVLSLLLICQQLPEVSMGVGAWRGRFLGTLLIALAAPVPLVLQGIAMDAVLGGVPPWHLILVSPLRATMFWLPLCLLAQARWLRSPSVLWRILWLTAAFLVQSAVLPASLPARSASISTWMAALVAAAAGLVALAMERSPSYRSRSSCE